MPIRCVNSAPIAQNFAPIARYQVTPKVKKYQKQKICLKQVLLNVVPMCIIPRKHESGIIDSNLDAKLSVG